ncbi:hypothetical protein RHMOL_Rhmol07G0053300 [Rhododendron molle]|uniref:Uncharacterized protein n=1 Tax=Rhododendron molle TaxID=49168 RepID=A0ACC0MX51_RHOML|nr:hypothetical protein RHMOL_Rhmol07G0053300 [Rhododendron molle]
MPCIRTCAGDKPPQDHKVAEGMSRLWENWDLRILALYILVAQLYLHFFGRRRTKTKSAVIMIGSVWLLYSFSDLLAAIALGKLSKLAVNKNPPADETMANSHKITTGNGTIGDQMLRVMWGPLILFYLGGPDTITVLSVQENRLWMRHLVGLFTQGFRTVYALIATWSYLPEKEPWKNPWSIQVLVSLLALLILIPGIIKYGERVWIIQSRNKYFGGFVRLLPSQVKVRDSHPNEKRVLLAYFCIQTLMPHCQDYPCDKRRVGDLERNFIESVRNDTSFDAFKLIDIELGLIYDMLFSKIGTIFTIWGSILRFLSFSLVVSGLVIFLKSDKPPGLLLEGDDVITYILIAGAIFLEIAGIVVQLLSDWAVVWACHIDRIKWATPLLYLHDRLFSERQRWPEAMGQLSLRDFFKKHNPNVCTSCLENCLKCLGNAAWKYLFGMDKKLKGYETQKSSLLPNVKNLIISHLLKKYDNSQTSTQKTVAVDNLQTSTEEIGGGDNVEPTSHEKVPDDGVWSTSGVTRGEWTLEKYDKQLKWSIKLQFDRSIVIWHVATEVCYGLDRGKESANREAVKMLSDYMMYLLVVRSTSFPFCNNYDKIEKDYDRLKELIREGSVPSGQKRVENEGGPPDIADEAQKLVQHMKEHPKRWAILESIWAEMLCYAAWRCRVNYHIEGLRHGGEFLTRVWLLQMHFDRMLRRSSSSTKSDLDQTAKTTAEKWCDCFGSTNT